MKRSRRSLNLTTETIQQLSTTSLEHVVGGDGLTLRGPLCRATLISCAVCSDPCPTLTILTILTIN
jgi:hypothetical protein